MDKTDEIETERGLKKQMEAAWDRFDAEQTGDPWNRSHKKTFEAGWNARSELLEQPSVEGVVIGVRCPKCGELATHRTPDGTWWDSNAHYWRTGEVEN